MEDYLDGTGKFDAHKWLRKNSEEKQPLKEQYIEGMYDLDDGLDLIKDAWMGWRKGIETQASDIKPAQKELVNYVTKWLKKNIR